MPEKRIKLSDNVNNEYGDDIDNMSTDNTESMLVSGGVLTSRPLQLPVPNTTHTSSYKLNRILFGAPGTGKSNQLDEDKDKLLKGNAGTYERVTFYPEYTYSQFVGCYKPVSDNAHHIDYEFVPGPFLRVLVDAIKTGRTQKPQPHLLIIEEINRAKPATVFGDVFQLLDRNKKGSSTYRIHTSEDIKRYLAKPDVLGGSPENYEELFIPNNMYIWASMNSADQGVQPMDTAFKRRWSFEYIDIDNNEFSLPGIMFPAGTSTVDWNAVRKAINDTLSIGFGINEDKLMGPYFISGKAIDKDSSGNIANQALFLEEFKSKVLMYLFEDAGRRCRADLFKGCTDISKFSAILKAFDEKGLGIFSGMSGDSEFEKYYKP